MTDMPLLRSSQSSVCVCLTLLRLWLQRTERSCFLSREEFCNFFKIAGTDQVSQYAGPLWDAGHKSCRSVANVQLETLEDRYGADIGPCYSFCSLHIGQYTLHVCGHHANNHLVPWRLCFQQLIDVFICCSLKKLVLQPWTRVLGCFNQRFQSRRCRRVLLALIRLRSPGHLTLTSWKRVILLRMFWHTLIACIPPRSGSRQLTLSESQYVRSVPSTVTIDQTTTS